MLQLSIYLSDAFETLCLLLFYVGVTCEQWADGHQVHGHVLIIQAIDWRAPASPLIMLLT